MKTLLIVFFIVNLFILILVFPYKTRIMSHVNLIEKKGFYSIKSWRVKILCGKIYLDENNNIKIENTNNVIKNRYKDDYMKEFIINLIKTMQVKKMELYFNGGLKKDSFSSAMMCGTAMVFVDMIYAFLSQNYIDVKLFEDIKPTFDVDSLELTFDFVAAISMAEIISSFIKAKKYVKGELNERK